MSSEDEFLKFEFIDPNIADNSRMTAMKGPNNLTSGMDDFRKDLSDFKKFMIKFKTDKMKIQEAVIHWQPAVYGRCFGEVLNR